MTKSVLISGAGVAGPSLAFWLKRYGYEPTIVERAPRLRTGGYMIDFWGVGYDTAERMGILAALKAESYDMSRLSIVNARGRRIAGFGVSVFRRALKGRYFSILRSDLARLIYGTLAGEVETIFDDGVTALLDYGVGVDVTFHSGKTRRFDLVIGADGLHSAVRAIAFGPEERFESYLGYYVASFIADGYKHRDEGTYVGFGAPGRQIARYSLSEGRTGILFIFARDTRPDVRTLAEQKRLLREIFGGDGWETPDILDRLDCAEELYFDPVSQIRMNAWSKGRIALLGDAAFCPSLLSGQGTAFAMACAYILAGELKSAGGDHAVAFARYEARFRDFIVAKQKAAVGLARSFAPRTEWGMFVRNRTLNLMRIPFFSDWMIRGFVADKITLPDYS